MVGHKSRWFNSGHGMIGLMGEIDDVPTILRILRAYEIWRTSKKSHRAHTYLVLGTISLSHSVLSVNWVENKAQCSVNRCTSESVWQQPFQKQCCLQYLVRFSFVLWSQHEESVRCVCPLVLTPDLRSTRRLIRAHPRTNPINDQENRLEHSSPIWGYKEDWVSEESQSLLPLQ